MAGKFEITPRGDGEFQFNLKAENGQVIMTSEGYSSLFACRMGVESVRVHAADPANFDNKTARDGSAYFSLKAGNGQSIGKSELYASDAARDSGIRAVMEVAPGALVADEDAASAA